MDRLSRGRELDRIELESREFFARVRNTYHQLAADEPLRIKKIMTNHPIAHTREQLVRHLEHLIAKER